MATVTSSTSREEPRLTGRLRRSDCSGAGIHRVRHGRGFAYVDGGLGLATLNKEHVVVHGDSIEFNYRAKAGIQRRQVIDDPPSYDLIRALRRRRRGGPQLLAYRAGHRWHDVTSDDINDYL